MFSLNSANIGHQLSVVREQNAPTVPPRHRWDNIFKLTAIDASVIYRIPWIHGIFVRIGVPSYDVFQTISNILKATSTVEISSNNLYVFPKKVLWDFFHYLHGLLVLFRGQLIRVDSLRFPRNLSSQNIIHLQMFFLGFSQGPLRFKFTVNEAMKPKYK